MKSAKIVPATAAQSWLFPKISANPLFTLAEKRRFYRPKLPAPRADVTVAGRARHRGFVLPRRLRLLSPPKAAHRCLPSSFAVSATLPHVGATSGFLVLGGYALGCVRKAAQIADTGATARNEGAAHSGAAPSSQLHSVCTVRPRLCLLRRFLDPVLKVLRFCQPSCHAVKCCTILFRA